MTEPRPASESRPATGLRPARRRPAAPFSFARTARRARIAAARTAAAALALSLALAALAAGPGLVEAPASAQMAEPDPETVVVYLVRHAEKAEDGTDDPPLALAGKIRVQHLLQLLADADLTHVHTTDWKRTRDTARPIAEAAGVEPAIYDPGDPAAFAAALRAVPARHLVVGHSNTTPDLVAALGGDPAGPIDDMEYDRLYVVVITPGGGAVTNLLRFGEPFVKGQDFGLRADWTRRRPGG